MNPSKKQPSQGSFDPRKGKQEGGGYQNNFLAKTMDSNVTQEVNETSANIFDEKLERLETQSFTSPASAAMKNGLIAGGKPKNGGKGTITRPSL